jgi:biotin-[acetyl-CoA-carboxylase] ligase BirA-like protein
MELTRTGQVPLPFAVHARRQSKGRGRLGHHWESPSGNLFLSLGLPVTPEDLTWVPIAAAVLVAEWLLQEFGLRVTLKWPNDIYFAGQKLSGILCEMHAPGGKLAASCVVGIGINLAVAPTVTTPFPRPIALRDIIDSGDLDSEACARSLAAFIAKGWGAFAGADLLRRWQLFAIAMGQPWCRHDNALAYRFDAGLNDAGNLQLSTANGLDVTTLTSAHHEWRWVYMREQSGRYETPFACIEIGNSTVKFQVAQLALQGDHDLVQEQVAVTAPAADAVAHWKKLCEQKNIAFPCVFLATVAPAKAKPWLDAFCAANWRLIPVEKRWVRANSTYDVQQIGLDRVAAIEAAYATKLWEHEAVLLVSAGTALTVDVLTARQHLGGYITVGIGKAAETLPTIAPALPHVAPEYSLAWPRGTHAAIGRAVVLEKVGFIRELQAMLQRERNLSRAPQVIVTGGDRGLLAAALPEATQLDAAFLFRGYAALALGG